MVSAFYLLGQNTPSSGSTYSERALVWAKFHTHPFWPARVGRWANSYLASLLLTIFWDFLRFFPLVHYQLERRQEKHKWLVRFVDDQVHHQV